MVCAATEWLAASCAISSIIADDNVMWTRPTTSGDRVQVTTAAGDLDKNRPTFKLMPTLVLSIGMLVLLSVGSVLVVNWIADLRIVQEFTSRLITRMLSAEERSLREHLDAAVDQGDFIAAADRQRPLSACRACARGLYQRNSCGGAPNRRRGLERCRRERHYASSAVHQPQSFRSTISTLAADSQFAALAGQIRTRKHPYWGPPIYREQRQRDLPELSRSDLERGNVSGVCRRWNFDAGLIRAGKGIKRSAALDILHAVRARIGFLPIPS